MEKYNDIEIIGKGGNGVVWKTQNSKNILFAKKTIKHYRKSIPYQRFCDEIEVIRKFPNPGIIQIVDYHIPSSKTVKETPYYIMPLALPLKNHIKKLSIQQTFDLIVIIIDTVEFLHDNDITHRDIKIENILIIDNYPKLSDFGLANFPKQKRLSRLNEKIGPAFTIAPEMRRISSTAEYKKADVYSLAKTIWVILTKNWTSFDGQYNSHSSINLRNYIDLKINEMVTLGETYYFSLVILEKLLFDSTHNDPDKRPTIKDFKERFNFWVESNSDYTLRNGIEWEDAIKQIFPVSVPENCAWNDIYEIENILKILFTNYDSLNHTFFPHSGGLDFTSIEVIEINKKKFLLVNNEYFFEPEKLYFESMNNFAWSYFRLEIKTNKPFFGSQTYNSEELVYLDSNMNIFEKEISSNKSYSFCYENSFLITQKMANINALDEKLDHYYGLHSKMTNSEYRELLEKVIGS